MSLELPENISENEKYCAFVKRVGGRMQIVKLNDPEQV